MKAVQNEILDVATFASTKGTPKSYKVVTLTLNAVNKGVTITAVVTPIICPPLSSTQQAKIPVEFKTLAFADKMVVIIHKESHRVVMVHFLWSEALL